jgi:methionyl-tRNA formyltransferase
MKGGKMMRIVFFTNKSARGAEILTHMRSRNIPIEAIFIDIERRTLRGRIKKAKSTLKRIGSIETSRFILKKLRKKLVWRAGKDWKSNEFYRAYSGKVFVIDNFNGAQSEQLLKEIEPDIVVLGGSRIIRKNIIKIPKIGILNAHPGLLPKYRGVDVIPWAIYQGDPIGVTIHFIDEGVDTGRIVAQKIINVTEGDTLDSLMKKANEIAGELMSEVILQLIEKGHIQVIPQSKDEGKQYYRMPIKLRQETERKLKEMIKKGTHYEHKLY